MIPLRVTVQQLHAAAEWYQVIWVRPGIAPRYQRQRGRVGRLLGQLSDTGAYRLAFGPHAEALAALRENPSLVYYRDELRRVYV